MGSPRGASPPMRMTASWSRSDRPPNTRLWGAPPSTPRRAPLRSLRFCAGLPTGCRRRIAGDRSRRPVDGLEPSNRDTTGARHPTGETNLSRPRARVEAEPAVDLLQAGIPSAEPCQGPWSLRDGPKVRP